MKYNMTGVSCMSTDNNNLSHHWQSEWALACDTVGTQFQIRTKVNLSEVFKEELGKNLSEKEINLYMVIEKRGKKKKINTCLNICLGRNNSYIYFCGLIVTWLLNTGSVNDFKGMETQSGYDV